MSTVKFCAEVPSKVTGPEFIEFGPRDSHKHLPDTVPHLITKCENVQGDGEAGTIRDVHFIDGFYYDHIRTHTDHIDHENHEFKFHLLAGGSIGKKLSAAHYDFKFYKNQNGEWIFRAAGELTPLPGVKLTDADVEHDKKFWITMHEIFQDYLQNTPDHGFGKGSARPTAVV